MSVVSFVVHGVPAPAGSKRGFYNPKAHRVIITDDSKRSRPWKAQVADAAADACDRNAVDGLLQGPLELVVTFVMPRPKAHFGAKGVKPSAPAHPTTKPDTTKLLRAVEDACTGVLWRDDAQIVTQVACKQYGEPALCRVEVRQLEVT